MACYPIFPCLPLVQFSLAWGNGFNPAPGTFLESLIFGLIRLVPVMLGSAVLLTIGQLFGRTSSPGYWFVRLILVLLISVLVFVVIR